MPEFAVLGQRLPRVDAQDKVTGKAVYAADVVLPNMLHGKILRSPYAHARIKNINLEKAKALDGVRAIITAADNIFAVFLFCSGIIFKRLTQFPAESRHTHAFEAQTRPAPL